MTRFEKSQSSESFRLLITPNVALSARQSRLIISGLVSYGAAVQEISKNCVNERHVDIHL